MVRYISLLLFIGLAWGQDPTPESDFSVMTWNIWHGGREDGEKVGPQRVIRVIKNSRADIIAMQETYGSGELISEALGFNFLPRGTNVSIMSRFQFLKTFLSTMNSSVLEQSFNYLIKHHWRFILSSSHTTLRFGKLVHEKVSRRKSYSLHVHHLQVTWNKF